MFNKFRAFITRQKLHDFDLENYIVVKGSNNCIGVFGGEIDVPFQYNRYKCKHCDKTLGLDEWQMRKLPWSMKIGCKRA
jgi:hypothetical protein